MSRRIGAAGRNPWQRDGRDPISRLRDEARWEDEVQRAEARAWLLAWAGVSLVALGILGVVAATVLALNGKLW